MLYSDEEDKEDDGFEQYNEEIDDTNSKRKNVRKYGSDNDINPSNIMQQSVPNEFTPAIYDSRKLPVYKSYAENEFFSPTSHSGSVSIPFNFTSDQDGYERSSVFGRSNQLRKAGASIMSGSIDPSFDKKTTVRIRGKHTEVTEGVIDKTLQEQEEMKSKKKEIRRANERLKTLEKLELYRQEKVKNEIERLEEERRLEEFNREQKRRDDGLKRRKIAQQKRMIEAAKQERMYIREKDEQRRREKEELDKIKNGMYFETQKQKIATHRDKQKQLEYDLKSKNLI